MIRTLGCLGLLLVGFNGCNTNCHDIGCSDRTRGILPSGISSEGGIELEVTMGDEVARCTANGTETECDNGEIQLLLEVSEQTGSAGSSGVSQGTKALPLVVGVEIQSLISDVVVEQTASGVVFESSGEGTDREATPPNSCSASQCTERVFELQSA